MSDDGSLTERELEILNQVATGASNRQIAARLHISSNTVKVHLRNVYHKLGVASRTEAIVFAIQANIVEGIPSNALSPSSRTWWKQRWVIIGLILLFVAVAFGLIYMERPRAPSAQENIDLRQVARDRWQAIASMSTPRKAMAVATYEGEIYAIGGETKAGVSNLVDRYDPDADTWETLPAKPTAVTDAQAIVSSGKIYVVGGREAGGKISDVVEAFDPESKSWSVLRKLPEPLSRYAAVPYEGRILLFGGWNGEGFVSHVYQYEPNQDAWSIIDSLRSSVGDLEAAVSGGRIYLLGGFDGRSFSPGFMSFDPNIKPVGASRWTNLSPIPHIRQGMKVVQIADIIYVVGGSDQQDYLQQYNTRLNEWLSTTETNVTPVVNQGVVSLGRYIYVLGGEFNGELLSTCLRYQAIYTLFLPGSGNQ